MSTWLLKRTLEDVLKIVLYMHETQMNMIFQCFSVPESQNRNTPSSTSHFILFRVMVDIKALVLTES